MVSGPFRCSVSLRCSPFHCVSGVPLRSRSLRRFRRLRNFSHTLIPPSFYHLLFMILQQSNPFVEFLEPGVNLGQLGLDFGLVIVLVPLGLDIFVGLVLLFHPGEVLQDLHLFLAGVGQVFQIVRGDPFQTVGLINSSDLISVRTHLILQFN